MNKMNVFASIAFAGAVFAGTQGISETVDAHHPAKGGSESSASAAPAIQAPLADMMAMMQMMASMQSMDSQMMGMTQRVEGRIAFLKAELGITEAQLNLWNDFADALRTNADGIQSAVGMTGDMAGGDISAALTTAEQNMTARLDGLRAMKHAYEPLAATFTEAQRATAEELLPMQMGLKPMMPAGGMGNMAQDQN